MRRLAGLIRLFVGNQLDRIFFVITILEIRPLAFLVGRPERAAAIYDLFSIFIDDRFDIDAAGRRNRKIVSRIALAVGVYIRRGEFPFVQNVIVGGVLVAVVFLFLLFLLPLLLNEFQRDFFRDGMAGIVRR